MKRSLINAAILAALGVGAVFPVSAQQVNTLTATIELCAGEFDIPANTPGMNNPDPIRMWGYALGEANDTGCVNTPTSPGPSILLPNNNAEDDPSVYDLSITVHNRLPRATSLVVPGLMKGMTPSYITPGSAASSTTCTSADCRVHSFDTEIASGDSATYDWNGVTQGAYIYQSGTHQQVQVQMGLVGAIMSDVYTGTAARAAYPGLEYDTLYPFIYSEIDPVIHSGVALGEYDGDNLSEYNAADMKSTINYAPKYFGLTLDTLTTANCPEDGWCVQGNRLSTFEGEQVTLSNMANGSKPVFRLFNGSTRIHTPTLIGGNFEVIAEDGNVYPNKRVQYAVSLPPLKTKDAILDTSSLGTAGGTIRLTDSAMNLSNPAPDATGTVQAQAHDDVMANGEGKLYAELEVESHTSYNPQVFNDLTSPTAIRDGYTVMEGAAPVDLNVQGNDTVPEETTMQLVSQPDHGTATLNGNMITYAHDGSESRRDSFLYSLVGSDGFVSITGVVVHIDQQNDAPVAADDSVTMKLGESFEVRVLNNDTDAEGSRHLRVVAVDDSGFDGTVSFVEKAVTVTGSSVTTNPGVVVYTIEDDGGLQDTATISVTVNAADSSTGGGYTGGNTDGEGESVITVLPPVAIDDSFQVSEGGSYNTNGSAILGVLVNDTVNGAELIMAEYPQFGKLSMEDNGSYEYEHNGGEETADSFSYTLVNSAGSATATVSISIVAKKDPPRVNNDRARTSPGQSVLIDIFDNDRDGDSAVRSSRVEIVELPQHGVATVDPDTNQVLYAPADGFTGKDTFKYRLYDAETGEASKRAGKVKIRVK